MSNSNIEKLQLLRKKILGIIVTIGLIFSTLTVLAPVLDAQGQKQDKHNDKFRYEERDPHYAKIEFDRGYRDGKNRGREDAREHKRFDPDGSIYFKDGSKPYREGFMKGCRESYRQHSRHHDCCS